jgi:AAHS family 4-hydroxybenzoate transporter-like MFS transporter
MPAEGRHDLESIINRVGMSRLQTLVIAVCTAVMIVDGFDTQVISFAAPGIAAAWQVPPASFGFVFGIGLFGGLVGALCTGVIADRIGRKPTLMITVLLFGVASLATPFADSMTTLGVVRFVTGLGVGGALPGAIALAAEYAPQRARAAVAAITFCGIPLGSVIGSVISSVMIPAFGWESVFVVGGLLPLLLLPLIVLFVPESIRFLALKRDQDMIARLLTRMGVPEEEAGRVEIGSDLAPRRAPVRSLFTEGRALGTTLLSLAVFLTLLMAFLVVNWIPTLATRSGIGTSAAILGVAALNIGGILGALVISRISLRRPPGMVISLFYALGAVAIATVGQAGSSGTWLLISAFAAGFLAIGAQMTTVALLAIFYDTRLRATGVGWAMACGRVGGIIGPVLGGLLVAASIGMGAIFAVAGLVCAACAVTVFGIGRFVLTDRGPARPDVAAESAAPNP